VKNISLIYFYFSKKKIKKAKKSKIFSLLFISKDLTNIHLRGRRNLLLLDSQSKCLQ
jgi:hypothetical protein